MRFDDPKHQDYILGDLNTQTIAEILQSEKYIKLKNRLGERENFVGFENICTYCTKIKNISLQGAPNGYEYIKPKKKDKI